MKLTSIFLATLFAGFLASTLGCTSSDTAKKKDIEAVATSVPSGEEAEVQAAKKLAEQEKAATSKKEEAAQDAKEKIAKVPKDCPAKKGMCPMIFQPTVCTLNKGMVTLVKAEGNNSCLATQALKGIWCSEKRTEEFNDLSVKCEKTN